jgi:hypothetical protein
MAHMTINAIEDTLEEEDAYTQFVSEEDILERVKKACREINDMVVVTIIPSWDDEDCWCVNVFGVRPEDKTKIQDAVFSVGEELFGENAPCLLPMIRTLEDTEKHYPEHYTDDMEDVKMTEYALSEEEAFDELISEEDTGS